MRRDESPSGSGPGVAADPMIGQVLDGRYRLTDRLGEGGMGEVYAAEHVHIEKRVAIKLLRSEILTNQEAVTRFRQEARSASSIGHKNIITIEDFGQLPDGRIYLAMELLNGAPLNELLKGALPAERLIHILIQTGHGLSAAHKKGIVHRDMKPENVFVTLTHEGEDVPKLLDFGIAKVSGADGNNHLTRTGTIFGTPFYMAPEQALGQNVDHRADVYAMGVIMYEVFGGAVPFQGESFMGILTQHITAEPKPLPHMAAEHGKTLPPGIEEIITRAMRKDPDQRFQTMDDLVAALVSVYRGLAGAGMSSYLPAHGSSGSGMMPQQGGFVGRSGTLAVSPGRGPAAHTPNPYVPGPGGPPMPGPPYHVPHPDPQFTGGMHAADSGVLPRKKSYAGLIAILFVLMAAAGGGIALLVLSQDKTDDDPIAQNPPPDPNGKTGQDPSGKTGQDPSGKTSDPSGKTGDPVDDKGGKTGDDKGGKTGDDKGGKTGDDKGGTDPIEHGSGDPVGGKADAGAGDTGDGTGGDGTTGDGGDDGPAVAKVVVLVNSRPQGAEIIGADGKSLGRTPTNVWVEPGQPLEVTLKLKGRKELRASIDDRKKKLTLKLEKLPRPDHGTGGDGGDPGPGPVEPKGPCDEDPNSTECRCQKDPSLPECELE
jgi:tRNA A-37 threonylcarbamoyl transferase component Bud32